jgi:hypothetical protein
MSARSTAVPGTAVTASSLGPVRWLGEIGRRQPVLAGAGVLVAIAIAPMALAGGIDGRLFNGIDVWIKPIKFAVAVTIYMFTLAFFAGWVGDTDRSSR